MDAGRMDKRVSIMRNNPTTGDFNEPVDNWVEIASVWAEIVTPTAKEIREGQNLQVNTGQIRIYPTDITHEDRIHYGAEVYEVLSVLDKVDHYLINFERVTDGAI